MACGLAVIRRSPTGDKVVDLAYRVTPIVKELLGTVAVQPLLELGQMLGVGANLGQRNLMAAEGPLHLQPVDVPWTGPALGGPQDHHRPFRAMAVRIAPVRHSESRRFGRRAKSRAIAIRWWTSIGSSPSKPPSTMSGW